jgi:iron complex outermembrane receptor protein
MMHFHGRAPLALLAGFAWIAVTLPAPTRARAAATPADSVKLAQHAPDKYEVLVSATRRSADPIGVPNGAAVVSGEDLRRRGARTVADALQDVVGLDTGDGSDGGLRMANIGMWGLKEFDALLVTLDGVPVGGPFNPSLTQLDVNDVDRVEIVKGPQGTLYGVAGFAGMVQMFSRRDEAEHGHVTVGGGSFSDLDANAGFSRTFSNGLGARLSGLTRRADGWQDRTGHALDRGALSLTKDVGKLGTTLSLFGYRDDQRWGTPMPYDPDGGAPLPGFQVDRNYAVSGAHIEHRVFSAVLSGGLPLDDANRLESSVSYTRDNQVSLTSFPADFAGGDTVGSAGVELHPHETTFYADAHVLSHFAAAGAHELVGGAAITWGRTTADGIGFDFDQLLSDPASIPGVGAVPVGDHRSFEDRRTFVGVYAHDAWTPRPRVTIAGGGRYDNTSEKLNAFGQEVGFPAVTTTDEQTNGAWSGDLSGLVRLAPSGSSDTEAINAFLNWKSSFKPAAPNLTEAEAAEILDPERSHSVEGGLKLRSLSRQVELEFSMFQMDFSNMVISTLDAGSNPVLMNGGTQRFKGEEINAALSPRALKGVTLRLGYAHHDARFVRFTFVDPDGVFQDVSGNRLEMTPADLWNARLDYRSPGGLAVWGAVRHQGDRALDRDNIATLPAFEEYDAGASYAFKRYSIGVTGRNLGEDRHLVTESEVGDAQFYVAAPARVTAQLSAQF